MANKPGDFWTASDSIEDIEADQPYGIISMIDYGMSEGDTSIVDQNDEYQFGYGRGIPIRAAYSELAADIRHSKHNNEMGKLLTTEDVLQLNLHDQDKVDTETETAAMLRSIGINKYDDPKFNSYRNEESSKILSKPIVNGRGFPILLDDSFHKFNIKPKVNKIPDVDTDANIFTENDSETSNNDNIILSTNNSQCEASSSNNLVTSTYVGFANVLNPKDAHTRRHKQPTIGIDREKFLKPVDVYFERKTKHIKKKSPSTANNKK